MANTQKPIPTVPGSSPNKRTIGGTQTHAYVQPELKDLRAEMCIELSGHFVGEMPVKEMFVAFLPITEDEAKKIPKGDFSQVLASKKKKSKKGQKKRKGKQETEMYKPLAAVVKESNCCPSFTLVDTHNVRDKDASLGPDLILFLNGEDKDAAEDNQYFARAEVIVEVKPTGADDAFVSQANNNNVVKAQAKVAKENPGLAAETQKGFENRGQQIDYATQVMTYQDRTHLFTISIIGRKARILRWDRSGTIVSAAFDYMANNFLAEFFYRYECATPAQRGHDTTVTVPTNKEVEDFENAVEKYLEDFPEKEPLFDLRESLHKDIPARKLRVYDKATKETSEYVVRKPFFDLMSLIGRGTRGYLAWGIEQKRLVFVKDSWRTNVRDVLTELQVYELLLGWPTSTPDIPMTEASPDDGADPAESADADADESEDEDEDITGDDKPYFPHLPKVLKCGDVQDDDGQLQQTLTHKYSECSHTWAKPSAWIRPHVHTRIVQELLLPLHMVPSSKQLTQAIRDVLELVRRTSRKPGKVLHRDISSGNIMLDETFRGILNDWDHAIKIPIKSRAHPYRTGTWQFMSISILQDPTKPHEVHDDIESCFWVFLYIALRYFKVKSGGVDLSIFDEANEEIINGKVTTKGGHYKLIALHKSIPHLEFESKPLTAAIKGFAKVLRMYHSAKNDVEAVATENNDGDDEEDGMEEEETDEPEKQAREEREEEEEEEEELEELKRKLLVKKRNLRRVYVVLNVLDKALGKTNWPKNDAVKNQHPKQTANAERKTKARARGTQDVKSHQTYLESDGGVAPADVAQTPPSMALHSSIGEKRRQPDDPMDDDDRGEGPSNGRAKRSRSMKAPVAPAAKPTRSKKPSAGHPVPKSKSPDATRTRPHTRSQDIVRAGLQANTREGVRTRSQSKNLGAN